MQEYASGTGAEHEACGCQERGVRPHVELQRVHSSCIKSRVNCKNIHMLGTRHIILSKLLNKQQIIILIKMNISHNNYIKVFGPKAQALLKI